MRLIAITLVCLLIGAAVGAFAGFTHNRVKALNKTDFERLVEANIWR